MERPPREFEVVPPAAPPAHPAPPPPPPVVPPPPPPPAAAMDEWPWALVLAIAAWVLLALSAVAPPAYALSLAAAVGAIIVGTLTKRKLDRLGLQAGRAAAVVGLVLGIVHVSLFFVVPLLFFLVCCAACASGSSDAQSTSDDCGCDAPCVACCDGCTGACDECCSGCACAAAASPPALVALRAWPELAARLDRAFAHHPAGAAFAQDVYLVRHVRFCVGCFTTYPVFLASLALLALVPAASWGGAMALGALLAAAQGVSSAGLARRRWQKATVKTLLGLGMALLVTGTLASPLPAHAQAAVLLALLGLASLSALPRALRLRRARASCACAQAERAA